MLKHRTITTKNPNQLISRYSLNFRCFDSNEGIHIHQLMEEVLAKINGGKFDLVEYAKANGKTLMYEAYKNANQYFIS